MFVGGLSWQTSEDSMKEYFAQFGPVVEALVMRDPATKHSRGFGFVTFASSFMTEAALDKAPFEINGAKITPKRATPDVERFKQTKQEFNQSNTMLDQLCEGKRSIFVGALRDNISEEDLEQYFSGFGRVVR